MRNHRRPLTSILAALLVEAMGSAGYTAPVFQIGSVTVAPGQTTNISVSMTGGTQSYAGFNATLHLPAVCRVLDVQRTGLLADSTYIVHYRASAAAGAITLGIVAQSASATFTGSGDLCSVRLLVPDDAPPGTHAVGFAETNAAPLTDTPHALGLSNGTGSASHAAANGVLTVRRAAAPGDVNGNGIPDDWEIVHFGGITNVSNTTDFDRDGLSDYYEFVAGTDPRDAGSCLRLDSIALLPALDAFVLSWYSIPGRLYSIERTLDMQAPAAFAPLADPIAATPPLNVYTDTAAPAPGPAYYRIELLPTN